MRGNTRGTQLVLTHEIDIDIVRLPLTHLILSYLRATEATLSYRVSIDLTLIQFEMEDCLKLLR